MDSHERAITTEDGEKKIHPEACVEDFENKDVEHTLKHDLETEDRKALFVVREDLGRQLGLASDRQNATLQIHWHPSGLCVYSFPATVGNGPCS